MLNKKDKNFGKYLYLGCGNHRLEKFTHVDISLAKRKRGFPDINSDISKHIDLPSNHSDFIFSRGTMEHLKYAEFINCLLESYRVLKNEGIIRMLVPDFDLMIKSYLEKDNTKPSEKEMPNFDLYDQIPLGTYSETFVAKVLYHDHYYLHNFQTISDALQKCGFINIRKVKPGETLIKDLSEILFDAEVGRDNKEIIVEAQRGDKLPQSVKIISKPLPRNIISKFIATFFNIEFTNFIKRKAMFPQPRWFVEKIFKIYKLIKYR